MNYDIIYKNDNPQPPPVPPPPVPPIPPTPVPQPVPPPTPTPAPAPGSTITPIPTPVSTANVVFMVTDNITNLPVKDAEVTMDKVKTRADETGMAVFTNVAIGDHRYTISKREYMQMTGRINVTGNITVPVKLAPRK